MYKSKPLSHCDCNEIIKKRIENKVNIKVENKEKT